MEKVWVVWDPLYEKVISVHRTETCADCRCVMLNEEDNRLGGAYYFENSPFELED